MIISFSSLAALLSLRILFVVGEHFERMRLSPSRDLVCAVERDMVAVWTNSRRVFARTRSFHAREKYFFNDSNSPLFASFSSHAVYPHSLSLSVKPISRHFFHSTTFIPSFHTRIPALI